MLKWKLYKVYVVILYQFQIVTFYIDIILILNWVQMNINDLINYTCDDSRAFLVN